MNAEPFVAAARELRHRFFALIDSLSTLGGLTSLPVHQRAEDELLADALDVLIRHQDMERCSIFLLSNGRLECAAGLDWDDLFGPEATTPAVPRALWHPVSFEIGEGVMGAAAREQRLVHCRDCVGDERFVSKSTGRQPRPPGSLVSAPIVSRGTALGVVNIYHPDPDYFESWHEHTLTLFSGVLAHMLEHSRLARRMEEAVQDRTRRLEAALREAEQLKRRFEELSNVDELTSLHNRRFFFPEAEAMLSRATRYRHPFSLMLIDIDRFKHVNDEFGHAMGDQVLRDVASELRRQIREGDVIARFGGEEFVVALANTDLDGAIQLAERIRQAVAELLWSAAGESLSVTISLGLTALAERERSSHRELLEELLREADHAMYRSKSGGRNQVSAFQPPAPPSQYPE